MIGIFDSGLGGLTIVRALAKRCPRHAFVYLGDQANAPYGGRSSGEIVALTRAEVDRLFRLGARLVVLGCNTATAVALRTLQQQWLPGAGYPGRNVRGTIALTVEAATQTPWSVTTPQSPQQDNHEVLAVFGTSRTVESGVYGEEVAKRCPRVRVVERACTELVSAIEEARPRSDLEAIVRRAVRELLDRLEGEAPDRAILGCTLFALVEDLFAACLPDRVRILSQPEIVADRFKDYLARHPEYTTPGEEPGLKLFTTGDPTAVSRAALRFWPELLAFEPLPSLERERG